MDSRSVKLDLSAVDPVDVVMAVAQKAGLAVPDSARAWLAAAGAAPGDEAAPYVQFLTELREAEVGDLYRDALETALGSARGDTRLAHLLGQATAVVPPPTEPTGDAGETSEDTPGDNVVAPRKAPTTEVSDDSFAGPADDPIDVLLAAARKAGVPVPAGARAWLSAPRPAPFDESWAYRRMLTALTITRLPPDVRATVDDAKARARSNSDRLAELLGARDTDLEERPARFSGLRSPELPRRVPGPDSPSRGRSRQTRSRGRDGRRGGVWRQRLALVVLAFVFGAAATWGLLQVAPRLHKHLPSLGHGLVVVSPEGVALGSRSASPPLEDPRNPGFTRQDPIARLESLRQTFVG